MKFPQNRQHDFYCVHKILLHDRTGLIGGQSRIPLSYVFLVLHPCDVAMVTSYE